MARYLSEFEISPGFVLSIGLISRQNNNVAPGYDSQTIDDAGRIFERLRHNVVFSTPYKTCMGYRDLFISHCGKGRMENLVFETFAYDESDVDVSVLESEAGELLEAYKAYKASA